MGHRLSERVTIRGRLRKNARAKERDRVALIEDAVASPMATGGWKGRIIAVEESGGAAAVERSFV